MVKNKFFKNLYQSISFLSIILILLFVLLLIFFETINRENDIGWILLLIAITLIVLFFLIGFYWIFQKVEIDKNGIRIKIFQRVIRNISWDSIEEIEYANVMRNPAYVLKIKNGKNLNLDSRQKIKSAISYFGNERIKEQVKTLIK